MAKLVVTSWSIQSLIHRDTVGCWDELTQVESSCIEHANFQWTVTCDEPGYIMNKALDGTVLHSSCSIRSLFAFTHWVTTRPFDVAQSSRSSLCCTAVRPASSGEKSRIKRIVIGNNTIVFRRSPRVHCCLR